MEMMKSSIRLKCSLGVWIPHKHVYYVSHMPPPLLPSRVMEMTIKGLPVDTANERSMLFPHQSFTKRGITSFTVVPSLPELLRQKRPISL